MLFVSAGVTNNPNETIADVTTEEFVRVMVTNALSSMRVVEALSELVRADGTIGVMSSGQGSVSNNTMGKRKVYRGSKAALNMFMRSFTARYCADRRTLVLMAPGWVRTAMGASRPRCRQPAPPIIWPHLKTTPPSVNPGSARTRRRARSCPLR